jgi:hypothetical protein
MFSLISRVDTALEVSFFTVLHGTGRGKGLVTSFLKCTLSTSNFLLAHFHGFCKFGLDCYWVYLVVELLVNY